jgi:hypothetical protein
MYTDSNKKIHEKDIVFELIIELIFFIPTTREMNNKNIYKITCFLIV